MAIWSWFTNLFNERMQKPQAYGSFDESWFHVASLVVAVVVCALTVMLFMNASRRRTRCLIAVFGGVLLALDALKILISFHINGTLGWNALPKHICSTSMYAALAAAVIGKGRIYNALIGYLATFGLLSGFFILVIDPSHVFVTTVARNVQSMVYHIIMVALGFALLISKRAVVRQSYIGAPLVFLVFFLAAMLANWLHNTFVGTLDFNALYLNPELENCEATMRSIQRYTPHAVYLLIYYTSFTAFVLVWIPLTTWWIPKLLTTTRASNR